MLPASEYMFCPQTTQVLTLSAVLAASLLEGSKLSERLVLGLSACSFLLFSALAVRDGVLASRQLTH